MMLWHRTLAGVVLLCMVSPACNHNKKKGELVSGTDNPLTDSVAFRDTVSEVAWVEGLRRMRVRGYGIVAGLGTHGSSECPRGIRHRLVQEMYKMEQFAERGRDALPITPEQIIDDRDTAVVMVEGEIPAAAQVGDRFDLTVRALSGTQTTSLEGGRLYDCDLRIQREVSGGSIEGKRLATGTGPMSINPWSKPESAATQVNLRIGAILGGGKVEKTRRLRLVLEHPSYRQAIAMANCINTRFPRQRKVADGQTPAHVKLRIPREYADDPKHFLDVVRHLYLPTTPGFLDCRAAALAEEILDPDAPHMDIVLAFEGIGRTTLPLLHKLYGDARPHVSFHAGLAGMRLEDKAAIEPVAACALNPRSPYRPAAIRALAAAKTMYRPASVLRTLLDDADPRIRVMAYEGLCKSRDDAVVSTDIGGDSFRFDIVPCGGRNLIYATRTRERRIALLGGTIRCVPPVFFCDAEGTITITADQDDQKLTLLRKARFRDRVSPPIPVSLNVADLIPMLGDDPAVQNGELVSGLAIPYSLVVKALADLCRSNSINADFMLEQATITEMFGPLREGGRGESEL